MEIINSSTPRRTVLLVTNRTKDMTALHQMLSRTYRVCTFSNRDRDFSRIRDAVGNISVVIVCAADAAAENYALFRWISRDSVTAAIPLLLYCGGDADFACAEECLKRGAVDIITPPLRENIILHRLQNAIRLKDSATFYEIEKMLKELPSNIYLKDAKGRYVFATHYWHHLEHADDPHWTIRGKTDLEIRKDKENAQKALETDLEILETGIGKKYIIETNTDGEQEFLEIIKEPLKDASGTPTGIIALINNVTEKEHMRMQLERFALRDGLTGIRNKKAYDREVQRLDQQIGARTARFGLAMIDLNYLKQINDTYGHERGDTAIKLLCGHICGIFKRSPVFRVGGDEFVIVLEGEDLANFQELRATFLNALDSSGQAGDTAPWERVSAAMGMAEFDSSTDASVADVFARADGDMYACKKAMKTLRTS